MNQPSTSSRNPIIARRFLSILAWCFLIFIVLQVLFAGTAMFMNSSFWSHHVSFPRFFFIMPLIMAVIAYFSRLERKIVWQCIRLMVMMIFMFFTAAISARVPIFGALHPVLALVLFWSGTKLIQAIHSSGGK